jgi:predicted O-methyltransferase YrrM
MSPKNPRIYPITITNPVIEDYCLQHSSNLPKELYEIEKFTKENILAHRMLSNHIQSHFLIAISKMINPQNILEIGTFTGYSTTCLYQGLVKNGKITTIEKKQEFSNLANDFFTKFGYHNIQIITGDALSIIPSIQEKFDLIYLDADKENILKYYQLLLPLLNNNGWLIIDNTLWKGLVSEPAKEPVTKKIQEFNDFLAQQTNVFYTLLPIRDGITLIKKI